MSQENVELGLRIYEAFTRRDLDAFLALMDDDVEAVPRMVAVEGGYHGHDGIRRWWRNLLDIFPDYTAEVVEVRDLGDLGVGALRVRGHGAGSDTPFEQMIWLAAQWRDGKCTWWATFYTEADALEAAGLREQAMSQENVEVVQRWVEALNADDTASFLDVWDPECEFFSVTGSQTDGTPYRGHDGLRRYRDEASQTWTELRFDPERILEGKDENVVVAVGRLRGAGRRSGVLVEHRIGIVYELRDRKIRYARSYLDPKEALQAAGLGE